MFKCLDTNIFLQLQKSKSAFEFDKNTNEETHISLTTCKL